MPESKLLFDKEFHNAAVMPEGEKLFWGPVVIGEDNLPSPVGIGLTELPNIKKEFCYCKVAASLNRFK